MSVGHSDLPVAVVADAHLGGAGGDAATLVGELDALEPSTCGMVLFLGDLFHVWVGDRRFESPEIAAVTGAIAALRERGIPSVYIEGNRDFFIAGSDYDGRFDVVGFEHAFTVGTTRYLAVHGDGLNDRDWQYRGWRWLSKSAVARLAVRLLPPWLVERTMIGGERRLAKTNFRHRQGIPEAAIRAYAERRLAEGHDVLLLGHFHESHRLEVRGGSVRIYDAWYEGRTVEWLEP